MNQRTCVATIGLRAIFAATLLCLVPASVVTADEANSDYSSKVKPLLKARCYACHGSLKQEAGLRLDTAELIRLGGDSGEAVIPGDPASSLILDRITTTDLSMRMPPEHEGEPFEEHEIDLVRHWIQAGAPAPENEAPESDPQDHWSFRPIQRKALPRVANKTWVRNPIDAWIAAGHEQQGLKPQDEASKLVLLRRVYLDLIGLPPTTEEIASAQADSSPDWYDKVVDRLLADPRYGERWGRHWMDVWRYSDWWGLNAQLRNSQRHMWHWRDWIVESLNDDRPYDEMVRMMLAADELAPNDPDELRASGFLARNYFIFNRDQWMDEVVTHVSKGFLGLTMNCAKCHDHKFDPLPQEDYYKMRAFFEPYHVRMDMVSGETNLTQDGIPRAFDGSPETPTYLYVRGDESNPDKSHLISPGIPELLSFEPVTVQPVDLPRQAWQPGRRPWVIENHITAAKSRVKLAESKRQAAVEKVSPTHQAPSLVATNEGADFAAIVETFDTLDLTRWKLSGDGWSHTSGELIQKTDGTTRYDVTLLEQVPRDFEAVVKFRVLGGTNYRSVGLDFDVATPQLASPGNQAGTFSYVYLSDWDQDSKIQGAYSKQGKSHYPGTGRQSYSVDLDKEYTLNVKVRGTLINVSINGEHVLAWRTPLPRQPGAIRLMTFDALVAFDEFQVTTLDPSIPLQDASGLPTATAKEQLALAEADLKVAQADLKSVELRAAAINSDVDAQAVSNRAAILAERELAVVKAQRDLLSAEQTLSKATEKTKAEAEKKLTEAKTHLEKQLAVRPSEISPEETFTPFQGAQWSATRFLNTGKDDPTITFPSTSTGRRSALAHWITDRRNPLTARVAVNHLWNRHFGTPLAAAPFDLGRNSPTPEHPELIDWLATELMGHDWSMKHLHRLIVTSATYRMGSTTAERELNLANDPDNHFLWHRNPMRLESQAVRDSVLYLAGTLDMTMGGPSVPTEQQSESKRRSLYFFHSNNERNLFLLMFDEAEVTECYQREQSVVPQQALAMSNSDLVLEAAQEISQRLSQEATDDGDFIRRAFVTILGITPGKDELTASQDALAEWQEKAGESVSQARTNLVWILLNHNDFVTVR
ncbi:MULTISPECIES: PSD1 and planctomycete cytochrome C domain-containing protein [Pirellulaceae]|nr:MULTISPECIES: PSD1 and planctomycete cytochrome C domain-containing protein [Pirellulaceae]